LERALIQTHPRFFVSCLGRAVKPYRLLLPALAPAASAGFRLVREGRASARTSLPRASFRVVLLLRDTLPRAPAETGLPAGFDPLVRPFEACPFAECPFFE
jgi:hypothetical protein